MEIVKQTVDPKALPADAEIILNESTRLNSHKILEYLGSRTEIRICPVCGELYLTNRMSCNKAICHECRARRSDEPGRPSVEILMRRQENKTRREAAEAKRTKGKPPECIETPAERIAARRKHLKEIERQHMESRAAESCDPNDLWQAEIFAMVNANHARREKELKKT